MVGISDGRARMAAASVPRWRWMLTRKRQARRSSSLTALARRSEKSAEPPLSIASRTREVINSLKIDCVSSPASGAASARARRPPTRKTGGEPAMT